MIRLCKQRPEEQVRAVNRAIVTAARDKLYVLQGAHNGLAAIFETLWPIKAGISRHTYHDAKKFH